LQQKKNAVKPPIILTTNNAIADASNKADARTTKKTPAVTIVAACNNEDTGVGPSIASGNQGCKPICADLPTEPPKSNKAKKVSFEIPFSVVYL
jgi:hypothetical protein